MQTTSLVWLRSEWLWCLLPCLLAVWALPLKQAVSNPWHDHCDAPLLEALTVDHQRTIIKRSWVKVGLAFLLSNLIIALAGPSWQTQAVPLYQKKSVIVVALDMSAAMLDEDLPPSRLARAKYKLADLFKLFDEGNLGLIAYTKEAFIASPITSDTNTLLALLPSINYQIMPVHGSDANAALTLAGELITQSHFHHGNILLITAAHIPDQAQSTAAALAKQGIHTHVYGLRHDTQYHQLSLAGQGRFFPFSVDDSDVKSIYHIMNQGSTDQLQSTHEKMTLRLDQGHWFLWLCLPFILFMFQKGRFEEFLS